MSATSSPAGRGTDAGGASPTRLSPSAQPAYPEYEELAVLARQAVPAFVDVVYLRTLKEVVARRGSDWCSAVLGRAFPSLWHTPGPEAALLLLADEKDLDPPLPEVIVEARRAADQRHQDLLQARRRAREADQAAHDVAVAGSPVLLEVRANTRGRRYSSVLNEPLRHLVPAVPVTSGAGGRRMHEAGRALCESARRARPLELAPASEDPATCQRCLAHASSLRPPR